tara:strand:+ start:38862 stop:44819 length:5958 start_codon:yes stop_codon:yes gene_type:complete
MAFSGSLNFISASDIGSARYAGGNRQYAWTHADADTITAVNQFIPVDFVGLNTIIREEMHFSPTGEGSANILSASLFYSGIFGQIVGSFKTGSVLNFNESWPANGAFKRATGAEGIKASQATVLNSLLLNRQGPYQHPSWKQTRYADHPVARKLRRMNTASIEVTFPDPKEKHSYLKALWKNKREYEEVQGVPWGAYSHILLQGKTPNLPGFIGDRIRPKIEYYYEPTVVSKFKPLIYDTNLFLSPGGSFAGAGTVRMTLANELSFFTNTQLNSRIKISQADPLSASSPGPTHGKQQLYGLFHASHDVGATAYLYSETIFPKSVNAYRPFKLKRPHYEEEPGLNSNGYDRALNRSFWREMQRGRTSVESLELPPIFSDGTSRLRTNQSASNSQNWPQHTQIPHLIKDGTINIANGLTSSVIWGSGSSVGDASSSYGSWNHITHYISPGIVTNGIDTLTGTLDTYGNLNVQPYGGFVQHILYQPYPLSLLSMWPLDVREDMFDVFTDSEGNKVVPPFLTSSLGGKGRHIGVSPHSVPYLPPSTVYGGTVLSGSVNTGVANWLKYYIHAHPTRLGAAPGMVTRSAGELAYSTKPTIFYYRRSQTNQTASATFVFDTTAEANSTIALTSSHGRTVIYKADGSTNLHANPIVVGFSKGSSATDSAANLVNAINAVSPASASAHSGSSAKFGPYYPGITASYDSLDPDRVQVYLGQTSPGYEGQTKIATAGDFTDSTSVNPPAEFTGGKNSESGYASPTASLQYLRHTYPYNTPFYVTNKVIGRDPMYDNYNSFIGDIVKYLGRDYSLVSEFKISPNYKYYHEYVGGRTALERKIYEVTTAHPNQNFLYSKPIIRRKKRALINGLLSTKINNLSIEGGEISSSAGIESLSLLKSPPPHPDTGEPQRWRYDNNFGAVESSALIAQPHHWDWDSGSVVFREKYLHTDDIINFAHLLDQKGHGFTKDVNTVPSKIKFVCRAVKKLLPYDGFYPLLRTAQLGTYLSAAFGPFITSPHMTTNQASFTQPSPQKGHDDNWGLDMTGDPDSRTTGTPAGQSGKLKTEQTQLEYSAGFDAARLQSLLEPMMAPGILYNSIKSGIAVEYPIYNKAPRLFAPPKMITGSQMSASFGYGGGYMLGESRTTPAILKTAPDYNLPFEALYDPAQVRFGVDKYKATYLVPDFTDFDRISSASYDDTQDGTPGHSANYTYSPNCMLTPEFDEGWSDPSLPTEVPEYFSAMNNFLAETMQFFLADQEISNIKFPVAVSKPKPKESLVFNDNSSVFYMSVGLRMGQNQIMCEGPRRSGYKIDPTKDFQKASSIRGYLYGPPIEIVPLTGTINVVADFVKNIETGEYGTFSSVGMDNYESYYAANLQDPAYQAFTPPYFYGESQIILNLTSSVAYEVGGTNGVSLPWIKEESKTNAFYFEKYNVTGGLAQWIPNTASVSTGSANRMKVEASIDIFNDPVLIKRQGQDEQYYSWYIAPKWICPILDFSSSFAGTGVTLPAGNSNKLVYETKQNTYHDETTGRSMWGGYGTDPYDINTMNAMKEVAEIPANAAGKGIYMTVGDAFSVVDESALPSDVGFISGLSDGQGFFTDRSTYKNTLPQTDSLLDKLGFEKRSYEIGKFAPQKSISEALVIIPYFDRAIKHIGDRVVDLTGGGEGHVPGDPDQSYLKMPELYETREIIPGKHFLPIQENVFERILSSILARELYDKDNPIFEKLNGSSNAVHQSALSTDCGKMIKSLLGSRNAGKNGYQLPPEFDFIHTDVSPFQMMVVPFEHVLKKQDLIHIYQGIMPDISMTAEKVIRDIVVSPTSTGLHDALLPEVTMGLPADLALVDPTLPGFDAGVQGEIVQTQITVDLRPWAPASFLSPLPFLTPVPHVYSDELVSYTHDSGGPDWPSWTAKDFYKNLKFMVFKVKERGQKDFKSYREKQIAQQIRQEIIKSDPNAPELSFDLEDKFSNIKLGEVIGHNWPYDYFSLIETIKVDIEFKVED